MLRKILQYGMPQKITYAFLTNSISLRNTICRNLYGWRLMSLSNHELAVPEPVEGSNHFKTRILFTALSHILLQKSFIPGKKLPGFKNLVGFSTKLF